MTLANVPPDRNSGAAGTVFMTNQALRELGHEVDEVWAQDLGGPIITHGNLHSLLEQPFRYRAAASRHVQRARYDVVQISQPQAYLAARHLKRRRFDGLVIGRSHGCELRVDATVPIWHRRLGVPESRWPRSVITPLIRKLLQRQWIPLARSCDGLIMPSGLDREFLLSAVPRVDGSRVRVIHHGVGSDFITREPAPLNAERLRRLLYVGQFAFIKGYPLLIEVLNRLLGEQGDLECTWVTQESGHPAILEAMPASVRGRVRLEGWRDQSALIDLYDGHGIFLFPSYFEGFGKAAVEAMARGMCLVASDTGGMHDYLPTGGLGHLCPVGDAGAFVSAIRCVLSNPGESREMGRRAAAWARDMTWRHCASRAEAFYRDLMARRRQ